MRAGIALGSNLGDRLAHLRLACTEIAKIPGVSAPLQPSGVYETEPVGASDEAGPFLNAVLEVEFAGQPITLLDALQVIEGRLGRPSKRPRNASRTIDLDVLYVGNLVLTNAEMVIPHPRLQMRRFVLQPLAEIRPELVLPGYETSIREMLTHLGDGEKVVLTSEALCP